MSLFESVKENNDNTTKRDVMILDIVKQLLEEVKGITEVNTNELKALSLIESDEFLKDLLVYYSKNKKHVKRKFSKEIIEVFQEMVKALQFSALSSQNNNEGGQKWV